MAFATVAMTRLRAGVDDADAPEELVQARLDDAHARVTARLSAVVETEPPPEALVAGEATLAAAYLLRTLAARAAGDRRLVRVGGQSVERGRHGAELAAVAACLEAEAWEMLAPFLAPPPPRAPALATHTKAVLGD